MDGTGPFPRRTGTADASVRPARVADARDVARVQQVTWRTAYRAVLPAAVLDDWDAQAAEDAWARSIDTPPSAAHGVLVALEGGIVVGFAAYGPPELAAGQRPDPAGPTTEIAALLVEPRWGRRGHGSRLLAAVADLAAGTGTVRLQAWLPEQDTVSAGFYESAGWSPDGWVRTLDTGHAPLREVRWQALLADKADKDGDG